MPEVKVPDVLGGTFAPGAVVVARRGALAAGEERERLGPGQDPE